MKSRILLDFLRFAGPKLNTFASGVYAAMNGNAYFPNPAPSLGELNTANQQFAAAMDAAQHFDRLRTQEKENAKKKLLAVLQRLAGYAMSVAGDDRAIQLSAGFHVNKMQSTPAVLGTVESFTVVLGNNSGEALISVVVTNALTYTYYWALEGEGELVWNHEVVATPEFLVTGLQPLKKYRFRVRAVAKNNQFVDTEEIVKPVL